MAFTESTMLGLGTQAPDFKLMDTVSQEMRSLADVRGDQGTVVMFLCNHCPYVLHVNEELVRIAKEYAPRGIGFVGISSNDVDNYPQDGPGQMHTHAQQVGYPFAYLYDDTQEVARAYDAACTPDLYVFDGQNQLIYRGRLDDSRPSNGKPLTGADLRASLDALLAGTPQTERQYPSGGCNIKWKQ